MLFLAFTLVYIAGLLALGVNGIDISDFLILGGFLTVRIDRGLQLVPFILFGLYVYKKQWFTKGDIGSWKFWGVTSLLFLVPLVVLQYASFIPSIDEINSGP